MLYKGTAQPKKHSLQLVTTLFALELLEFITLLSVGFVPKGQLILVVYQHSTFLPLTISVLSLTDYVDRVYLYNCTIEMILPLCTSFWPGEGFSNVRKRPQTFEGG